MLLIYTPQITSRHKYIFKLFFNEIYKVDFQITTDVGSFQEFDGAKLNYSNKQFADEIFIESFGLIEEKGINQQEINVKFEYDIPVFFQAQSDATMSFDVFSTSLLILYLPICIINRII